MTGHLTKKLFKMSTLFHSHQQNPETDRCVVVSGLEVDERAVEAIPVISEKMDGITNLPERERDEDQKVCALNKRTGRTYNFHASLSDEFHYFRGARRNGSW